MGSNIAGRVAAAFRRCQKPLHLRRHQMLRSSIEPSIVDLERGEEYQKVAGFVTGTQDVSLQKVHKPPSCRTGSITLVVN